MRFFISHIAEQRWSCCPHRGNAPIAQTKIPNGGRTSMQCAICTSRPMREYHITHHLQQVARRCTLHTMHIVYATPSRLHSNNWNCPEHQRITPVHNYRGTKNKKNLHVVSAVNGENSRHKSKAIIANFILFFHVFTGPTRVDYRVKPSYQFSNSLFSNLLLYLVSEQNTRHTENDNHLIRHVE